VSWCSSLSVVDAVVDDAGCRDLQPTTLSRFLIAQTTFAFHSLADSQR